ncbi:bcl-2-related protein A1 [Microcebus murinus]|uniref:bcl-2-related protein A1 n=1 Tax=Microcebus murinus TaxID=30608 RepID=UPI003F6D00ED
MEPPGLFGDSVFSFSRNRRTFSQGVTHFAFPPATCKGLEFSISLHRRLLRLNAWQDEEVASLVLSSLSHTAYAGRRLGGRGLQHDASRDPAAPHICHRVSCPGRASNCLTRHVRMKQLQTLLPAGRKMTGCEFEFTRELAQDYLQHVLRAPQPGPGPSEASRVLRSVASSVQNEVERRLEPCLDNFNVASVETARAIFSRVMEQEFGDGVVNWGRVVTVFAFGGVLTKRLLRERAALDPDACKQISHLIAEFVVSHTGEWIRQNGGWEHGFVKKFEPRPAWLTFLEVLGKVCGVLSLLHY